MEREVNNRSIIAVFLAQPERFEELLKEGLFDGALLKDIGGFSKPFSIWRISQCWEMLADPNDFIEIARPDVEDFKKTLNERQQQYLKDNAAIRKVVDLIVAQAKVEEKDESERIDAAETLKAVENAAAAAEIQDAPEA